MLKVGKLANGLDNLYTIQFLMKSKYYLPTHKGGNALIKFAKFEVETVLMAKTCNFDSQKSDFNSMDLKKTQKITKGSWDLVVGEFSSFTAQNSGQNFPLASFWKESNVWLISLW